LKNLQVNQRHIPALTKVKGDRIKNEINRLLQAKNGFKPYEKLQKIDFLKHDFTVGEELTNTFKKRRHVIEKKYRELIDRLFK